MHVALINAVVLATTTTKSKGSSFIPFLVLIALFCVGYFVLIRPARNRQRTAMQQEMETRRQIAVGEEVITTSGLIATIVAKTDDEVTLEIAPGVHARYVPAAIMRLRDEDLPPTEAPDITNHEVIEPEHETIEPDSDDASSTEVPPEEPDAPTIS